MLRANCVVQPLEKKLVKVAHFFKTSVPIPFNRGFHHAVLEVECRSGWCSVRVEFVPLWPSPPRPNRLLLSESEINGRSDTQIALVLVKKISGNVISSHSDGKISCQNIVSAYPRDARERIS